MSHTATRATVRSASSTLERSKNATAARIRPRLDWVTLVVVVALLAGASLRLMGGGWGLPLTLHPDEWVIVNGAIDLATRNSFEPTVFFRPDHLEIQLNYVAYTAYSHLVHHVPAEVAFANSPAQFYHISRTITAGFGVVMIVLGYLIGRRFSREVGALSALTIALYPAFVEHSHYATPDVPLTCMFMVVILACMHYLSRPGWASLLVASGATAAAIAIKYPGALATVMIAVVVLIGAIQSRDWWRFARHAGGAVVAVVGLLFMISPVLFTNYQAVVKAVGQESRDQHLGADGLGWIGNMRFYAETVGSAGGVVLVVLFALGVYWSIRRRLVQSVPLWLGGVFWIGLSAMPLHWDRWGLPMFLVVLLFAPLGAFYSWQWLHDRSGGATWARVLTWACAIIVLLNLAVLSVATTARFVAPDARNVSLEFLGEQGIDATNARYEGYTPLAPGVPKAVFGEFEMVEGRLVPTEDPDAVRFLLLSSCMYDRYKAEPERFASTIVFYDAVDAQFTLLKEFTMVDPVVAAGLEPVNISRAVENLVDYANGGMTGCTIKVYEMPAA